MPLRKALVLVNIGTPKSYEISDVRDYLDEFLMDPHVIRAPHFFRMLLVKGVITRVRPARSSHKYKSIWTPQGSPLLVESNKFAAELQRLMPDYKVVVAMRYAGPSFKEVFGQLQNEKIDEIIFAPLYPQYADSTTTSSLNHLKRTLEELKYYPKVETLAPFYHREEFINSWVESYHEIASNQKVDHVLFSYHALPEAHLKAKNPSCLSDQKCCEQKSACESNCYKAQCLMTTNLIAKKLSLKNYSTSFQSRVGLTKWTSPPTVKSVEELAKNGVKNLVVMSPSFVVDGLETLEEINMEIKSVFLQNGGVNFIYVPCLNDKKHWVHGFEKLVSKEFKHLKS